jgi:hypothetical protein
MAQALKQKVCNKTWQKGVLFILFAAFVVTANGCSKSKDPNRLPVFPVNGRLSVKGQAPSGAFVVLHPKKGAATAPNGDVVRPRAVVKPDGSFAFGSYDSSDGAPAGDYSVTVEWRRIGKSPEGSPVLGPNVVSPKYARPETSPLAIKVAEKVNELEPITLK